MLSDTILTLLIASISTLLGLSFKLCYNSRCKVIKCCCGEIQRDTEHEINIDMQQTPRNV